MANEEKKMMTVSKDEYTALLERVKGLESGTQRTVLRRPAFRTARIRILDGVPVVAYGKLKEKKIEDGKGGWSFELVLPFTLSTGETKEEVYIDFLRDTPYVDCKILKMEMIDEGIKEYGTVKVVEYGEWKGKDTGLQVPNQVVTPIYQASIELPDGKKVEMLEEFLNV
jgi:hypothetical protein